MESILETKAATLLDFLAGLRGTLSVTFEEGTGRPGCTIWLNHMFKSLVVCNPRKTALLKTAIRNDRIDAESWRNCSPR